MKLANNELDMLDSLFKPVDGGTYDGFIRKVTKNQIDFFSRGKEYTLNKEGIICSRNRTSDGQTWYSDQHDTLFASSIDEHKWGQIMLKKYRVI